MMSRWKDIIDNLKEPISMIEKIYLNKDDPHNKYWRSLSDLYIYM